MLFVGFSGNYYILESYVSSDSKENDKRVIYLDQPSLGISREHFLKDDSVSYRNRIMIGI